MTASRSPTSTSYNSKHNEANGEDNRDGHDDNRSWNCGVEGPTDDPAILDLRDRMRRDIDGDAAPVAGHADDPDGRRDRPHAERQQQRLLPGQRDRLAEAGTDSRTATAPSWSSCAASSRIRRRYPLLRCRRTSCTARRSTATAPATSSGSGPTARRWTPGSWADPQRQGGRPAAPRSDDAAAHPRQRLPRADRLQAAARRTSPRKWRLRVDTAAGEIDPPDRELRSAARQSNCPAARFLPRRDAGLSGRFHFRKSWGAGARRGRRALPPLGAGAARDRAPRHRIGPRPADARGGRGLVRGRDRRRAAGRRLFLRARRRHGGADPAARAQVGDVHGPSRLVDPAAYRWRTGGWRGRPWEEAVFYELHVGAFTPEGTFDGACDRLDHLADDRDHGDRADAGGAVRAATAAGAMTACCSTRRTPPMAAPEELKALIDAAHGAG